MNVSATNSHASSPSNTCNDNQDLGGFCGETFEKLHKHSQASDTNARLRLNVVFFIITETEPLFLFSNFVILKGQFCHPIMLTVSDKHVF